MKRVAPAVAVADRLLAGAACGARADQTLVHSERSLYREVLVYENGDVRCMCFTRHCRVGRQSCLDTRHPDRIVMNYPQMMLGALFVEPDAALGADHRTGRRHDCRARCAQLLPQARIDVVEIDPAVVRVARRYFGFRRRATTSRVIESGRTRLREARAARARSATT